VRLGCLVVALLCLGALAGAPVAAAAPGWTEIDKTSGQVLDVDADRILFRQSDDALAIKDRRKQTVTPVAVAGKRPSVGFLSPRGAIFTAVGNGATSLYELRDGSINAIVSDKQYGLPLKVAGAYAIYSYGDQPLGPHQLFRRDLNLGTSVPIAVNVRSGVPGVIGNDVAANGDVAYWSGDTINRYHSGISTQLSPDFVSGATPVPSYPRTDGTNVVWRIVRDSDPNGGLAGSGPASLPKMPFTIDDFTTDYNVDVPDPDAAYRTAGGWIAYTKGAEGARTVWLRDPSGNAAAISPPGAWDIFGLSDSGEVIYGVLPALGRTGSTYLGKAGAAPLDVGPLALGMHGGRGSGEFVFPLGGRWYAAGQGSLKRLSVTDSPTAGSETSIDTAPEGGDATADATFSFSSTVGGASFECQLDGSGWGPCTSPKSYSELLHGPHSFLVRAVEPDGKVDPEPASQAWRVEATPPTPFSLLTPADHASTSDATPTFSWGAASDDSGIDRYEVWIDGALFASLPGATHFTPAAPILDSTNDWHVDAVDRAGNVRSSAVRTIRIDTTPPNAALSVNLNPSLTGDTVFFDSGSADFNGGTIVRHQWDLDGDGTYERDTGTVAHTTTSYPTRRDIQPRLRVTDEAGNVAETSQPLSVRAHPPPGEPGASINDGAQFTNDPHVTVNAVWVPFARRALISNDGGFGNATSFPVQREIPWTLDSAGAERLPKTVYVRFLGAGSDRETFQDDIILDETSPTLVSAKFAGPGVAAASAGLKRTYRITTKVRDNVSGVGRMQITTDRKKPGPAVKYRHTATFKATSARIFVRVRDRAGNWSRWKRVAS
jgi:hypothetical protein